MKETRTVFEHHRDQHDPYARHPIMTPDMIRQLPARYALIVRGGVSPVIARLPMAWTDPAYKRARRAARTTSARAVAGTSTRSACTAWTGSWNSGQPSTSAQNASPLP
jgi:hypothetical protein